VTDAQRQRFGVIGIVAGTVLFFVGVFAAHFTGLPETNAVGQELYPHIPRCLPFEPFQSGLLSSSGCWLIPTSMQMVALIGSQLALGAIVFGWIWKRELTWARATVGAFIFTLEMLILLGIVPNQWLALAQGTLDWNTQRTMISIPKWLVLNNDVSISYGAVKDIIAAGYSTTVVIGVGVLAYQLQERAKRGEQPKPTVVSSYGRPVVKGER
jgi:uncharacterized membrane protein (Fun14 family)